MRKEVKPAVKCKCCGATKEWPVEAIFCNQCGKQIPENMYALTVGISNGTEDREPEAELCSWACVRAYLIANKVKIDKCWYVNISMPIFRENGPDRQHCDSGENFFKDFIQFQSQEKQKEKP